MGKLTNLIAGAGAGYMQGKRMKKEEARAEKMDSVYAALTKQMMGKAYNEANATTPAPAGSVGGAPFPVTPTATNATTPAPVPVTQEQDEYSHGGMVGGCLPMGDRMMWQRQSFKKK